jgi:hypothetical protein
VCSTFAHGVAGGTPMFTDQESLIMSAINPQPLPPAAQRIRVLTPYDAFFNLEKMNKITAAVLNNIGCRGCHSGVTLDFTVLQEFVVDPATLEVRNEAF